MHYDSAIKIANKYLALLKPVCERAEIGGSLRRECRWVKDIEIICIPKKQEVKAELFAVGEEYCLDFVELVNSWTRLKGDAHGKYTQRLLPENIVLDLFMATRDNWGFIHTIRTGPASFSKGMVSKAKRFGVRCKDGYVYDVNGKPRPVPDEKTFFEICNVGWIEPPLRISV